MAFLVQFYGHAAAKPSAMQAAVRQKKGADRQQVQVCRKDPDNGADSGQCSGAVKGVVV
ncbi:hypothetical protein K2480_004085 [Salmonella enterica]|nr:hypothetical protein [Salmonella enterica]HAU3250014.1 hypothetical protein [Salmonella enterica subsp. houtenae]EFR2127539.1 hypothetical protein [Salmonella enterica]EGF7144398.1 hypothetical protein [Salmonella enterica]EGK6687857.1 hypothetical protein [Salmonella enterica]